MNVNLCLINWVQLKVMFFFTINRLLKYNKKKGFSKRKNAFFYGFVEVI